MSFVRGLFIFVLLALVADAISAADLAAASNRLSPRSGESTPLGEPLTPDLRPALEKGNITGAVVDSRTGAPLVGAQVSIPGTGIGTVTNASGRFLLTGVPAGEVVLRAELIGFSAEEQMVVVTGEGTITVSFELAEQALALDEIVVTGTVGQARRREVGNTISQIRASDIGDATSSVDNLLTARSPGVTVSAVGGSIGSGASIRLRGNTSATLSNQPLIYVDGVRVRSEGYRANQPITGYTQPPAAPPSPLNDIPPGDIDRIEIVKGAAATALYGAEAASGVIQIFTKRGQQGTPIWNVEVRQGLANVAPFGPSNEPYMKMDPWLRTAHQQQVALSVRGGSDAVRYYLSGGLEDNDGVLPNDHESRYSFRGNLELEPASWLHLQWSNAYSRHDLQNTPSGNTPYSIAMNSMRFPQTFIRSEEPSDIGAVLDYEILSENHRYMSGLTMELFPTSRVRSRVTLGYDQTNSDMTHWQPFGFIGEPGGFLSSSRWSTSALSAEYVGGIDLSLTPELTSTISWGGQALTTIDHSISSSARNFPGPGQHTISSGAERNTFEDRTRVTTGGLFLQQLIGYQDRYFMTLGVRADGSSVFGEALGLQVFPKATLSYVLSQEPFWPESLADEIKLRFAYGLAGRAPGPFDALTTWDPASWGDRIAFLPLNPGDPNVGPERTREIETGFDAAFFGGRLSTEFTAFFQRTTDALFPVALTPSEGYSGTQLRNVGVLDNRGIELAISGVPYAGDRYTWDAGFSLSTNRSKAIDLGGAPRIDVGRGMYLAVGQPIPVVHGIRVLNPNEIAEPELEEEYYFGPNQPTHTITIHSSLTMPGDITISARGEYRGGNWHTDRASELGLTRTTEWPLCENAYAMMADGRRDELIAEERALCDLNIVRVGMPRYPGNFFRLRDLTMTMPLPSGWTAGKSTTLTLSAQNWFTWKNSRFLAFDPEMSGNMGMLEGYGFNMEEIPAPRRASASIRVTF